MSVELMEELSALMAEYDAHASAVGVEEVLHAVTLRADAHRSATTSNSRLHGRPIGTAARHATGRRLRRASIAAVAVAAAMAAGIIASVVAPAAVRIGQHDPSTVGGLANLAANVTWFAVVAPATADERASYESCMSAAGYDMEQMGTPPIGEIPADSPWAGVLFQRASRTCIVSSGIGDVVGDSPEEVAAKNAKALGITECMRSHGWSMPEPTVHPVAGYLLPGGPIVPADPGMASTQLEDLKACAAPFGVDVFGPGEHEG